jgi:predicted ATPase/DNA-binding winged helix-turn-helix (wHTH) protein
MVRDGSVEKLRIFPDSRIVRRGNDTVVLGKRAFDVLLALAERSGELLDSRYLLSRCWQGQQVDESNLRIAVNALRKSLGPAPDGSGVINVPGRGYALALPASIEAPGTAVPISSPAVQSPNRVIGRQADIDRIRARLQSRHFVTVTGPGGVGKTTIVAPVLDSLGAIAVTHLELASLSEADLILVTLATQLRLSVPADIPRVIEGLRKTGGVLVIDNCEHFIDAVAPLAEQIFAALPDLMILTTSREPLRVAGETIYSMPPLACPDTDDPDEVSRASAVQLFIARASAANADFTPSEADLPAIARLCRSLDGLPLAIELAAARLDGCSLSDLVVLLDDRFSILTKGRRTAMPRHKTLRAMVDWSHALLSPEEQVVFRRVAVFPGSFDLASAEIVASGPPVGRELVAGIMTDLVAKSLVVVVPSPHGLAYRLLQTMRAYGAEALAASGEAHDIQARLATRVAEILKLRMGGRLSPDFPLALLDTVRAALSWAFSADGDDAMGREVVRAVLPYFFERGLMGECLAWASRVVPEAGAESESAAAALDSLRFLGIAKMFGRGNVDEARQALIRALHLATVLGDQPGREWVSDGLYVFHLRTASYAAAMSLAQENFASGLESLSGAWKIGISQHFAGQHLSGVEAIENCLLTLEPGSRFDLKRNGIDRRIHVLSALARSRWALGEAEEALRVARQTINEATALDHPVSLCIALIWCAPVFLWAGHLVEMARWTDRLVECGERYALIPYRLIGQALRGALFTIDGQGRQGLDTLLSCMEALLLAEHRMSQPFLMGHASEAFAKAGLFVEGLRLVTASISLVREQGCAVYLPQLLLLQAKLLQGLPEGRLHEAETAAENALQLATVQHAATYVGQAKAALLALRTGKSIGPVLHAAEEVVAAPSP